MRRSGKMRKIFFGLVIVSMIFAVQVFAEDLQAPFSGLLGWGLKTDVKSLCHSLI
jgi:hypothetical protein